jgi:hypothetical protein
MVVYFRSTYLEPTGIPVLVRPTKASAIGTLITLLYQRLDALDAVDVLTQSHSPIRTIAEGGRRAIAATHGSLGRQKIVSDILHDYSPREQ